MLLVLIILNQVKSDCRLDRRASSHLSCQAHLNVARLADSWCEALNVRTPEGGAK